MKTQDEKVTKLMSVRAAAEMLNISPWTLYSWISQRKVRSYKIGGRRLMSQSDIQGIIDAGAVEALDRDKA
jgi:excisionase family DNA binding protein